MDGFQNFLRSLGAARILAMGIVTIGIVALIGYMTMVAMEPDQGLLYTSLEQTEAAAIVGRLDQMNVQYRLADGGQTIYAAKPEIARLRVQLAGEGLGGSIVGYEIFDRSETLGTTSFVQNVNQQRAVEGELARTIQEQNNVSAARVHIVLPKRELFSREEQRPSASISLRTFGAMGPEQIRAIRHLVASAVPKLDPQRITITDQTGALLAKSESEGGNPLAVTMEERRLSQENRLRSEIESMVERVVGIGRVRAQVAIELDQNRLTRSTESYDPDSQVVRSITTEEQSDSSTTGQQAQDASIATNLPEGQATTEPLETSRDVGSSTRETINYDITRTDTTEIKEAGGISKLSVGVLVDGRYDVADDGTRTYQERPQAELDRISALVSSAIGINATRGDQIQVVNLQFQEPDELEAIDAEGGLFDFDMTSVVPIVKQLVILIIAILILLTVVRPLINALLPKPALPSEAGASQLEDQNAATAAITGPEQEQAAMSELAARAAEGDEDAVRAIMAAKESGFAPDSLGIESRIDVAQVEGKVQDSAIKKVGEIVSRHPEESASIIRQWLYS